MKDKRKSRIRRHRRVRQTIFGTAQRPRLAVFRSTKHIYVQAIDDLEGKTIASACDLVKDLPATSQPETSGESEQAETIAGKRLRAKSVGKLIAQKLKDQGIETVVFDRGGFLYHGRVKALADGAREGGLKF